MYNSKERISDKDTTELSYNQKINRTFTVDEILNSPLWKIKNIEGSIVTAIPLFNCDSIESFNGADIIIDNNKAIIMRIEDTDIQIYCKSDNTGDINYHNIHRLHAYFTYGGYAFGEPTIFCVVYDECGNPIPNALIDVIIDNEYYKTVKSDNEGICRVLFPEGSSTIQFTWHGFANTRSRTYRSELLTIGDNNDSESSRR